MVAFIQRDASPEIPPPYTFQDVTILGFLFRAELQNLQALCDQWLNNVGTLAQRGFEYRPFLPFVIMEIVHYPSMRFAEPPYSTWGFATQQELYFRFVVLKYQNLCGIELPTSIPELFFPYMFVNNSWSMLSGRNVIGFPKVLAQFTPAALSVTKPFPIEMRALALDPYAPTTQLDWKPVVTVQASRAAMKQISATKGPWPWIELDATVLERSLHDPLLIAQVQTMTAALPSAFSTVQLKQFRDAPSLTEACYQALVATPFTPSKVKTLGNVPPATVTILQYDSLDIPGAFGFSANKPLQPLLRYAVSLDMSMGQASNLFINT